MQLDFRPLPLHCNWHKPEEKDMDKASKAVIGYPAAALNSLSLLLELWLSSKENGMDPTGL